MHSKPRGGRSGLSDEQRGLATRYLPLAESLANAYRIRVRIEREELKSTAYMALVEAARTFDPARKVNFATFARHRIRGALRDYMHYLLSSSWRGDPGVYPAFQVLGKESERYGQVLGIKAEGPVGANIESIDSVEGWLRRLPKTHALACRLIYIGGKSQDEVAGLLGFSKSYLSRMHHQALSWLIDEHNAGLAASQPGPTEKADEKGK
jgi:RNA polymerase sigma factor (sigma-70 family)